MKIFFIPFLPLLLLYSFVTANGIESESTTINGIQLNHNENTTNTPEIVSIILLNATIKDDDNNNESLTQQHVKENINKSMIDSSIPTDINNDVAILNEQVVSLNESNNVQKSVEISTTEFPPAYVINVNDSQLAAHIDLTQFLEDNPDAVVITSKGYPNPYPDNYNETWSVSVSKGTGIDVIVHDLDINAFTDFLYFRGGMENTTGEKGPTITGHRSTQLRFKIMHTTNLFIWCHANQKNDERNYTGFRLTYAPFGEIRSTTTEPDDTVTVSPNKIQIIDIFVIVPKSMQIPETWQRFQNILSNSTNKFIQSNGIPVENASPENVTIMYVKNCPDHWPDSENCIIIRFGIPLWPIEPYIANSDEIDTGPSDADYELTSKHLLKMWSEFGSADFASSGILEYSLPDGGYMIVLWSTISLGIVATFILVLYMIWKMDLFQEYKRMTNSGSNDDRHNILKNQSEIDISMFPSPHQIVPTLFPTNETYIAGSSTIANQQYDPESSSSSRKTSFSAHKLVDFSGKSSMDTESSTNNPTGFYPEEEIAFSKLNSSPSTPRSRAKVLIRGSSKNSSTS